MKIQDIAFFVLMLMLVLFRRERLFLYAGLLFFIAAIPLFAGWIFFTAERLTWYGAGCITAFLFVSVLRMRTVQYS